MSNLDAHINILWLSDIHYDTSYSDKTYHSVLQQYLDDFHSYVATIDSKFDYILISGDIAQNGEPSDYDLFHDDIQKKLQASFPEAYLLVVPGNHDVARSKVKFIEDFINGDQKRDQFFDGNTEKFFKIFEPFTEHYLKRAKIPHEGSVSYKKHGLYGHVLDKKNKTIIVLLNSAWYAIGEIFLDEYIKHKMYVDREDTMFAKDILKITTEYGKQILALEILEEVDDILKILKQFPEYLVITTMHHPINWLWQADQVTQEGGKFHSIKFHSDILLTGHDHVHKEHPIEHFNGDMILHLKAGCFADFPKANKELNPSNPLNPFRIKSNWFSTLEINTSKRTIKQHRHTYDPSSKWSRHTDTLDLIHLNKKRDVVTTRTRLSEIKTKATKCPFDVVQHLFPATEVIESPSGIFRFDNNNIVAVFIESNEIEIQKDKIVEIYSSGSFENLFVVLIDLFNDISIQYESENNRLLVVNKIKNDYDFKFNKFRHEFFSNLSIEEVPIYGNLCFVSKLVPFWDIEHLGCS